MGEQVAAPAAPPLIDSSAGPRRLRCRYSPMCHSAKISLVSAPLPAPPSRPAARRPLLHALRRPLVARHAPCISRVPLELGCCAGTQHGDRDEADSCRLARRPGAPVLSSRASSVAPIPDFNNHTIDEAVVCLFGLASCKRDRR